MSRHRRAPEPAPEPTHDDEPGLCPCGTGQQFDTCCDPLHRGTTGAPTAEALMRSRFSAFAVGDAAYLLRTWHPTTRPARIKLDEHQLWTHLDILATSGGGLFEATGTVEFRAIYQYRGTTGTLHERSRFVREDGQWFYVGELPLTV